jgi:hypothetical protein
MTAAPGAAAKASFSESRALWFAVLTQISNAPLLAAALLFAERSAGGARQWSPKVALWMHSDASWQSADPPLPVS